MKSFRCILVAATLASGSVFAQSAAPAGASGFALAGHAARAPAHAAAVRALRAFAEQVDHGPALARGTARAMSRLARGGQAAPPGFPLAVRDVAALKQATIGWGFAVNDVRPANLLDGANLEAGAQPIGQWRYAIMVHGKPVGLVTMAETDDGWQAVSFGGAGLSADIDGLVQRYGGQPGLRMRYVRVPQASADFIEIKHDAAPARYVPLQAARASLHLEVSSRPVGAELVPGLREAVRQNMAITH